jgi:lysylphosphatidylglycerol synthetase-like protein (DUF2156 family)
MEKNSAQAGSLLSEAKRIQQRTYEADNIRAHVYLILAVTVICCVAPYDLMTTKPATAVCLGFLAIAVLLVIRELRRTTAAVHQRAMIGYAIVISIWSAWWVVLMTVVGPRLSHNLNFGWTLTGVLGTLPFLAGLLWERAHDGR